MWVLAQRRQAALGELFVAAGERVRTIAPVPIVINDWSMIDVFLRSCADAMVELAETDVQREGAHRFSNALRAAEPLPFEAQTLPALATAATLDDTELGRSFAALADGFPWIPSHRTTDEGRETALCYLGQMYNLGDVTAGLTYLDANRVYPEHNHPPQELYLTISGTAAWRYGGAEGAEPVGPNRVLYNHPFDVHSMATSDEPLVALWVLWD